jgi:enediyne biosynthesis protein E4
VKTALALLAAAVLFRERELPIHVVSGDPVEKRYLIEAMGGGVAVFDYDNDGLVDIYIVNGSTIAEAKAAKHSRGSALYRNKGGGVFEDVTARAGVANRAWGMGALAADFDGDGHQDLYVLNFGPNVLYKNNGDGTFRDVTAQSGLGDKRWSSAAAAADYDRDGDLDIFVANYLDYDLNNLPTKGKFCSYQNIPVSCGPRGLTGAGDALYRNNGDGTFTDVSARAGVGDTEGYYGLGAAWGDYDNDGDPDLFVANDNTPNYLYRNNGDGTFTDVAVEAGVAFSEDGREQAGMGVEFEDLDNDGWLDLMVTNFSDDYNTLYRNTGKGFFRDDSHRAGLVEDSWRDLSWGVGFFDFDNDGRKDVFVASGHIYPQVDRAGANTTYRQRNKVYLNAGSPKLIRAEAGLMAPKSYRGAGFADFNNDGSMDAVVSAIDARPSLLINETPEKRSWLLVKLVGKGLNRDGIGARVTLKAGGRTQVREIKAGGSYASTNDKRAHFGLGPASTADALEVRWPSGTVTRLKAVAANRILTIPE